MIVTIWWEDSRQKVRSKAYGPDQLLAACIVDELHCTFREAERGFDGQPKNGASKVMQCLKKDIRQFGLGPVCAVFDRDKVLDLWPSPKPASCKSGICSKIRDDAPGEYKLVLLHQNMESLVNAAAHSLGVPAPTHKTPLERDGILQRLAFNGTPERRKAVRDAVDGFNRLVLWTAQAVKTKL